MSRKWLVCLAMSLAALTFLVLHLLSPKIGVDIDALAVVLLVFVMMPWLAPIVTSIELPGGVKIHYRDVQKLKDKADKAGLLGAESPQAAQPAYLSIAKQDPNLALAGLRIEIEQRLRSLAEARHLDVADKSIRQQVRVLREGAAISERDASVVNDVLVLLNQAVHGAKIEPDVADWAIEVGSDITSALEHRLTAAKRDSGF